ncbi:hypothetical protein D9758_001288 [Tetrapyrgos nigripes]|uniref:WKF domain-containing protein n=1 Tax=Tetrapyrgos nigripes TaxID=182062 RepID=A0A8H5GRU8_9AGAR|nr:hypothetical protein D9758_001288 [Tetrapyrgos nigripes]
MDENQVQEGPSKVKEKKKSKTDAPETKKKKKERNDMKEVETPLGSASEDSPKKDASEAKKKKRKERSDLKEVGVTMANESSTKKDVKGKGKGKDSAEDGTVSKKEKKSGKKRKRDVEEQEDASAQVDEEEEADARPKKKKSKNKTGLADPSEDSLLSEQARKALEYAFTQFRRPKKWKFNKARQNWLIRNVWSPAKIPESQMPLVLQYLANVQGGTRENLVKTCQQLLESPADGAEPEVANIESSSEPHVEVEKDQAAKPETDAVKRGRASAILQALTTQ